MWLLKTEKAILAGTVSLNQLLSSSDGYDFIWYKNLDNKTSTTTENYNINAYRDWETDRKSTRLNSSHSGESRMPSSA